MPPPKVIAIGFDSADRNLISRWCDAGDLPVLRSLRDRAVSGVLTSPPGLGDDGTWASFYTAVSPGRHGRYHHRQLRPGTYTVDNFREARHESFWDALSRAGRKVAIVDVPKCPLSKGLNGLHVTDWLVHGRDHSTNSYPAEVGRELLRRFGDDHTDCLPEYLCSMDQLPTTKYELFVDRLLDSTNRKTTAVLDLLGQDTWDLFLVVFKEAHCAAHHLWHLVDPTHPEYRAGDQSENENPVKRVYRALDRALGQVLAMAGPETNVILFSDLGMAANTTGDHLLEEILMRLDSSILISLWRRVQDLSKHFKSCRIERATAFVNRRLYPYRAAFQMEHNEISGAVRVNVKGREPQGRVAAGPELEAFLRQLVEDLLDLVDPDSGRAIVSQVLRADHVFEGEHRDLLPDLLAVWNRSSSITAAASPKIGVVRPPPCRRRVGNHVSDGFLLAHGPAVQPVRDIDAASIMDLGPTISRLLGVTLSGVDGRCIAGIGA